MSDPISTIAEVMYGKSDDPLHPDNAASQDFQDGWLVGNASESRTDSFDIQGLEYELRGKPDVDSKEWAAFKEWKRGFWGARLRRAWNKALAKSSETA